MLNRLAVPSFTQFKEKDEQLVISREQYLLKNEVPDTVREVILSSWKRCKQLNVNPNWSKAQLVYFNERQLLEKKEENEFLLKMAAPVLEEMLKSSFCENLLFVLCDPQGVILDGKGPGYGWRRAEPHHFVPGADWSEKSAGTNAIGTALASDQPTQVFAAEHFCEALQSYVCSAAPIKDPLTNKTLGVLDITGEKETIEAHNLQYVISQAKKIEHHLTLLLEKENVMTLKAIADAFEEPFVVIDINGVVKRSNQPAMKVLSIHEGVNISNSFYDPLDPTRLQELLNRSGEEKLRFHNGNRWVAKFYPYKIDGNLLGGMVVFKKDQKKTKIFVSKRFPTRYQFSDIITKHPPLIDLLEMAKKAAFSDKTVLITGETGTGKEMLAQSIHAHGSRRQGPFVGVNCGAIPKELLASELFGYEKGAFTGAQAQGKKGKFLLADQGTILLDEIGDLPLSLQVSLLRVLEERHIYPLGGEKPIPVDVRVIAATNKDLEKEVERGNFREDLYYRLNVIHFHLPPLRERLEDLPLLIKKMVCDAKGREIPIEPEVMETLMKYEWPGNVRELKNVLDQALFYAEDRIGMEHLPKRIVDKVFNRKKIPEKEPPQKEKQLDERDQLLRVLEKTRWNITRTARILNVSRMTVYRKMKRYGL